MPGSLVDLLPAQDADGVSAAALALLSAGRNAGAKPVLWVRQAAAEAEHGLPSPLGLRALGLDPASVLLVQARTALDALQAGLDGARCTALSAIIIELWRPGSVYDLTASRRLSLAAGESGLAVMTVANLSRPVPGAARTRWRVRASPSRALAANAPGRPVFELTLLRARNGMSGWACRVEWNSDQRLFSAQPLASEPALLARPPLSGAVVPFPPDRPDASRLAS